MIRRPPRPPLFPYPTLSRSNSPATVRLEGGVKFTNPFVLTKNFPPAGTFTGTRTVASDPPRNNGSANTSHDPKSTRLNFSHLVISYAVFCLHNKHRFVNTPL